MKRLFITLRQAIRNGILRIFPRPLPSLLSFAAVCTLIGCAAPRQAALPAERVSRDTVSLSNVQYDSIYICQERKSDYLLNPRNPRKPSETDTLLIQDRVVEYRYRLLRDTVRIVRRDSIPYEVRVVETRVERYIPLWAKALSGSGAAALLLLIIRIVRRK